MNKNYEKIYSAACAARANAYVPYSRFSVGAVLVLGDGTFITGANIENASYSLTVCAERAALAAAYSAGVRKEDIVMLAVVGDTVCPTAPCGACRQVISELMRPDASIVLFNLKQDIKTLKVKDLLPFPFTEGDLNNE
ncbi:MAG: cytidine deaminase [Bacilli bacterium]|nr:cytidine deaminase [Bacilli bacterium]MDD4388932.1 cytidine deaminase [Bacilli bacterium]